MLWIGSSRVWLAAVALLHAAHGQITPISDADMVKFVEGTGDQRILAQLNAPVYFMGQLGDLEGGFPPCIPNWAYGGSETSPDIYEEPHRTPAVDRCLYPYMNPESTCRAPGVPIHNASPAFPVYFTVKGCPLADGSTDVWVALNLFYEKDGAWCALIAPFNPPRKDGDEGHDFDWENLLLRYTKNADTTWTVKNIFMSQHGSYRHKPWGQIQQTLNTDEAASADPRDAIGTQGLSDHPKIYIAWAKHPHFDTKNTGWRDILSQSCPRAFRSDDWWHFPKFENFIQCNENSPCGKAMLGNGQNIWGSANSIPPLVDQNICKLQPNASGTFPDYVDLALGVPQPKQGDPYDTHVEPHNKDCKWKDAWFCDPIEYERRVQQVTAEGTNVATDPRYFNPFSLGFDSYGAGPAKACFQHGVSILYPDGMPPKDDDWPPDPADASSQGGSDGSTGSTESA